MHIVYISCVYAFMQVCLYRVCTSCVGVGGRVTSLHLLWTLACALPIKGRKVRKNVRKVVPYESHRPAVPSV
jgi:hypothetical protein